MRVKIKKLSGRLSDLYKFDMSGKLNVRIVMRNFIIDWDSIFNPQNSKLREQPQNSVLRDDIWLIFSVFLCIPDKSRDFVTDAFTDIISGKLPARKYKSANYRVIVEKYKYAPASLDTVFRRAYVNLFENNKEVLSEIFGYDHYNGAINTMAVIVSWYLNEFVNKERLFSDSVGHYKEQRRIAIEEYRRRNG